MSSIPVRVRRGSDIEDRITAVAERLGATVEHRGEPGASDPTAIGDVEVDTDSPEWRMEAAALRALAPGHILFLCVANSARSQLAEGIARALAPAPVRISSAGSVPSVVRPQAMRALEEIGIDATAHRSKGVDEVERPVDAVITLCEEEVCPVWLESAWRLHWGLPDPAGSGETDEEEMAAFRGVRDALRLRLGVLFGGPGSA